MRKARTIRFGSGGSRSMPDLARRGALVCRGGRASNWETPPEPGVARALERFAYGDGSPGKNARPARHVRAFANGHTPDVDYPDAFADLAEIYLEDSWVLDVAATEHGVSFRLDAVLTPDHPRYHPPARGEQHCYRRATLTVATTKRSLLTRSDVPGATDASGELDYGNIDVFSAVDWEGESAWEMSGEWGELLTVEPSVTLAFEWRAHRQIRW